MTDQAKLLTSMQANIDAVQRDLRRLRVRLEGGAGDLPNTPVGSAIREARTARDSALATAFTGGVLVSCEYDARAPDLMLRVRFADKERTDRAFEAVKGLASEVQALR